MAEWFPVDEQMYLIFEGILKTRRILEDIDRTELRCDSKLVFAGLTSGGSVMASVVFVLESEKTII